MGTGHGWGENNNLNAAEFYNATHHILVNGKETFAHPNCNDGFNPHLVMATNLVTYGDQPIGQNVLTATREKAFEAEVSQGFAVYPNPADGQFTVEQKAPFRTLRLRLFSPFLFPSSQKFFSPPVFSGSLSYPNFFYRQATLCSITGYGVNKHPFARCMLKPHPTFYP